MIVYEDFFSGINILKGSESSDPTKSRVSGKIKHSFDFNKTMVDFVAQSSSVVGCIPMGFWNVDLYVISKFIVSKSDQISVCCISGLEIKGALLKLLHLVSV